MNTTTGGKSVTVGGAARRTLHATRRAELLRLADDRAREAVHQERMRALQDDFRHRSALAQEAVLQARGIRSLIDTASWAPPSDVDTSSGSSSGNDSDGAELRQDEIDRARDRAAAMGHEEEEPSGDGLSGIVLANALVERRQQRELRQQATGGHGSAGRRDKSRRGKQKGGQDAVDSPPPKQKLDIVYGVHQDVIDDEAEAMHLADELVHAVTQQEQQRNIQHMVLKYMAKEKPAPPDFDSTALTAEMDTLARQYSEAVLATENMLRVLLDPTGKNYQTNAFDGEIARIKYHQDVAAEWLPVTKDHAARYARGAHALTTGVSSEVNAIRKTMLDLKEECDLLARQCERKKLECDVASRRQEGVLSGALVRQVLAAGWTVKTPRAGGVVGLPLAPPTPQHATAAGTVAVVVSATPRSSRARTSMPTVPAEFTRQCSQRLRHHLTMAQSAVMRGSDPHRAAEDARVLEAIAAVLDVLKAYEVEHRDADLSSVSCATLAALSGQDQRLRDATTDVVHVDSGTAAPLHSGLRVPAALGSQRELAAIGHDTASSGAMSMALAPSSEQASNVDLISSGQPSFTVHGVGVSSTPGAQPLTVHVGGQDDEGLGGIDDDDGDAAEAEDALRALTTLGAASRRFAAALDEDGADDYDDEESTGGPAGP